MQKSNCFYLFSSNFLLHQIYWTFKCLISQNIWLWTDEVYLVSVPCTNIIFYLIYYLIFIHLFSIIFRDRRKKKVTNISRVPPMCLTLFFKLSLQLFSLGTIHTISGQRSWDEGRLEICLGCLACKKAKIKAHFFFLISTSWFFLYIFAHCSNCQENILEDQYKSLLL